MDRFSEEAFLANKIAEQYVSSKKKNHLYTIRN